MNWGELNKILIEVEKSEGLSRSELCKKADIDRSHVSKKVNSEPLMAVGSNVLHKLKTTYPTYFGMPPDSKVTAERALLRVLVREFAEYKASKETNLKAEDIIREIENKAKTVLDIAMKL